MDIPAKLLYFPRLVSVGNINDTGNEPGPGIIQTDYTSITRYVQIGQKYSNIQGEYCQYDSSAPSSRYPYLCYYKMDTGFKNIYNIYDRHICNGMLDTSTTTSPCIDGTYTTHWQFVSATGHQQLIWGEIENGNCLDCDLSLKNIRKFRFFIPPGTIDVGVAVSVYRQYRYGLVLRICQPPDLNHIDSYNDFHTHMTNNNGSGSDADQYLINDGDFISYAVYGNGSFVPIEDATWAYGYIVDFDYSQIYNVFVYLNISIPYFLDWYNTYNLWDQYGDPVETSR